MPTLPITYAASTVTAVRDWLRSHPPLDALVDGRVYAGGLPKDTALPAVSILRVGGAPDAYSPLDELLIQFDCWADSGPASEQLVSVLCAELISAASGTLLADGVRLAGVEPVDVRWLPDDSDTPRHVVTARVTIRPTSQEG